MGFKKLLGVILVVIVVMFALMLTTSYAWYSFESGSTIFSAVTNNDDIIVSFQRGEYINTNIAVPISSSEVAQYSEKNNFTIKVADNKEGNEMLVTISLVDIAIDGALQNTNFKVELYHQNKSIASFSGSSIGTSGATTKTLGSVVLDDDVDNNFELRVYILDNGADQSSMMNKTFQAKIQIDVVSRLKTTMNDWANPDIYISSIKIDGTTSDHLPTSGYYTMSSTCTKGSSLTWDPLGKVITYNGGSYVNDSCSLNFTSSTDYPLLNTVKPGSYVKYVGTNGCDGKACEGQNANYESDTNMGYCSDSNYKFTVNGWRVGYIKDGSVYLISAGAPECTNSLVGDTAENFITYLNELSLKYCNKEYAFSGVCSETSVWNFNDNDFQNIVENNLSSCDQSYSNKSCGYDNDLIDNGSYYWFATAKSDSVLYKYHASSRIIGNSNVSVLHGLRPVIRLKTAVYIKGGNGTYEDPYVIGI